MEIEDLSSNSSCSSSSSSSLWNKDDV
jgi:hypothetical protein